jgi:hypothetical protein
MPTKQSFILWLTLMLMGISFASAAERVSESIELAKTVPIADVHMHVVDLSASEHRAQMDRNRVTWGGGVGKAGTHGRSHDELREALGSRYFFTLGQEEFTRVFYSTGAEGLVDPASVAFVEMFSAADQLLERRLAYGFGELHVDNSKSFSTLQFARRIPFDNPVLTQMYTLCERHRCVIQIHMQADDENLAALSRYLRAFPNAKTVLSHALPYSKQPPLRSLLAQHPNLFLELSRKGAVLNEKEAAQAFDAVRGPKGYWLSTIEQFPDRFMLGSDTHAPDEYRYDDVMQEFRTALLPYLKPTTLKMVAHENAVRVYGLEAPTR